MLLNVAFNQVEDVVGILVCHEPARDLEVRFTRGDGLRAIAHETAPNPVEIDGRSRPLALQSGIAWLAPERVCSRLAEKILVRDTACRKFVPLFLGERSDLVIEAFNCDLAVRGVERCG